eukprot:scaffold139840_cov36-Tisochrysis_lutea.AAC.2
MRLSTDLRHIAREAIVNRWGCLLSSRPCAAVLSGCDIVGVVVYGFPKWRLLMVPSVEHRTGGPRSRLTGPRCWCRSGLAHPQMSSTRRSWLLVIRIAPPKACPLAVVVQPGSDRPVDGPCAPSWRTRYQAGFSKLRE